jgi:hypothetical protein
MSDALLALSEPEALTSFGKESRYFYPYKGVRLAHRRRHIRELVIPFRISFLHEELSCKSSFSMCRTYNEPFQIIGAAVHATVSVFLLQVLRPAD